RAVELDRRRVRGGLPGGVVGVRRKAKPHGAFVSLARLQIELREPGRLPDRKRKHSRRKGIKGPEMAHLLRSQQPPRGRHDIVRCYPRRFVDDQDSRDFGVRGRHVSKSCQQSAVSFQRAAIELWMSRNGLAASAGAYCSFLSFSSSAS